MLFREVNVPSCELSNRTIVCFFNRYRAVENIFRQMEIDNYAAAIASLAIMLDSSYFKRIKIAWIWKTCFNGKQLTDYQFEHLLGNCFPKLQGEKN